MTRFEKWSVLVASALTGITGLAYLWVKYAMESADPWSVINHPLQPWLLKSHILVSPLLVFAVGSIAIRHVWRHFSTGVKRGRRSGLTAAASAAPMAVSGYLIQAVTPEAVLRVVVIVHIVSSILFLLGVAIHAILLARAAAPAMIEKSSTAIRRLPPRVRPSHRSRDAGGPTIPV